MSVFPNRGKGTNCLLFIVEDVPDKSLKIRKRKAKVKSTQIFNIRNVCMQTLSFEISLMYYDMQIGNS